LSHAATCHIYNLVATNYIQDVDSNDDTVATSNQLGREGALNPTQTPILT